MTHAFASCDVIAVPAYPGLPSRLETPDRARTDVPSTDEPAASRASNSYIANMTGVPALVVPCGFSSSAPALPIAL
jgi:Asp-tRNA(Asn)/Glu-tRNA(Gln) amidotransferase A subunit family amidase